MLTTLGSTALPTAFIAPASSSTRAMLLLSIRCGDSALATPGPTSDRPAIVAATAAPNASVPIVRRIVFDFCSIRFVLVWFMIENP